MGSQSTNDADAARAHAEARAMSDSALRRLHAQGPAGLRPGVWDALDIELERRIDIASEALNDELSQERYPVLRVVIVVLKVASVFVLVASVIVALFTWRVTPTQVTAVPQLAIAIYSIFVFLGGLWIAINCWALAELLAIQIDIEANTRALRHPVRTMSR